MKLIFAMEISPEDSFSSCCTNTRYCLRLDHQISPTLSAFVNKGEGKIRPEVEDGLFLDILKALTRICEKLIPNHLTDVYFTYSMGSWRLSDEFFLKAHLTTTAFLSLTDRLCSPEPNPIHSLKVGLLIQEKKYHRGKEIRELFAKKCGSHHNLQKKNKYYISTVMELDYPLLCLYQSEDGEMNADIPATQLPKALEILEAFTAKELGQEDFSVGMVMSTCSKFTSHVSATTPLTFRMAAIVDEKEYARYTGKDEDVVKKAWGWTEQSSFGCEMFKNREVENIQQGSMDEEVFHPSEYGTEPGTANGGSNHG